MLSGMKRAMASFVRREDGPTNVEYAIMMALIMIVCMISVTALGTNTNKALTKASTAAS